MADAADDAVDEEEEAVVLIEVKEAVPHLPTYPADFEAATPFWHCCLSSRSNGVGFRLREDILLEPRLLRRHASSSTLRFLRDQNPRALAKVAQHLLSV